MHNPLCFWSNLAMLFPAFMAFKNNLVYTCCSLLICMGCSMYYHMDEESKNGLEVDLAGVVVLITSTFYMLFNMLHVYTLVNMIAIVYSIMAMYYYYKATNEGIIEHFDENGDLMWREYTEFYEYYHSAWHLLVVCFIAALVYSQSSLYTYTSYLTKPVIQGNPFGTIK